MDFNVLNNTFFCQSLCLKIHFSSFSIERLLQQKLQEAIGLYWQTYGVSIFTDLAYNSILEKITLYRLKNRVSFVYRCPIALRLAGVMERSKQEIATELLSCLSRINFDSEQEPWLDFTLVVESGWIDFYLSDRTLAIWLQRFLEGTRETRADLRGQGKNKQIFSFSSSPSSPSPPLSPSPPNLFQVQYTHARCCSLINLAFREGTIALKQGEANPIPWCNSRGVFRLVHPAERELIEELLTVVDFLETAMTSDRPGDPIKLAVNLSKAMLNFYRYCRIWGEVYKSSPKLAQARVGLITVVQILLEELLQKQIGVDAPVEL